MGTLALLEIGVSFQGVGDSTIEYTGVGGGHPSRTIRGSHKPSGHNQKKTGWTGP